VWVGFTGRFAGAHLRTAATRLPDIGRVLADSALIPPAACFHRVRGELGVRTAGRSAPRRRASGRDLKR
jgi:hypothetical protein